MSRDRNSRRLPILASLLIGLLLTMMPLPDSINAFRPDWMALLMIYWAMQLPRTWSVGTAWIIGITLDVSQGTLLGQHALALCVVAFITVRFHLLMRVFPLPQLIATVFAILGLYQFLLFWVNGVAGVDAPAVVYWGPVISSTVLWPIVMMTLSAACDTEWVPAADVSLLSPIKDHHSERRLFIGRAIVASVISILLLGLVIARLVQLQVFDHELFAEKSQGNRIRIEAVPPIRGLVFDRKGRVIAENLPAYQLELIPEQVDDIEDTLQRLAAMDLIAADDIPRFKELSRNGPQFKPVTLKFRLSDEEIANFAIQRPRFPGVDFQPRLVRHYRYGELFAHAVGYVGALNTNDMQRLDSARYAGTSHTGKTGIEASFEDKLHGNAGYRHLIANARGRQVPADSRELLDSLPIDQTPTPGSNVYLSLDLDLQRVAHNALEGRRGAVVALDPTSGEILALVSSPSFDPNLFAVGMTSQQFSELQNNPDRPLFNRAVVGAYPPGSTIKPVLALAALETGATNLTRKSVCIGYFQLEGDDHRYRDWKPEGHGPVDLHDAIGQSCDVYFYEISGDLGIDNMHEYLTRFGLGNPTGLDVLGERSGLVPSREWKRRNFSGDDRRWYHGETVIASIGQGFMLATPLQLASTVGTLATRGVRFRPHMVAAVEDALSGERSLVYPQSLGEVGIDNEFYWDTVLGAMHAVLQGPRGTARAVGTGAPYEMAGKSGTAQVISIAQDDEYDEEELAERLRDHALFVSFAPLDDPRIAVAVIVENGSSGSSVAAPIARAVMDEFLGYGDDSTE